MSWYYVKKLKTIGPLEKVEVLNLIQTGELCAFDLLSFKQKSWQFVYKFEAFFNYFKSTQLTKDNGKDWVVMKKQKNGGYIQMGPWTSSEVKISIKSGAIKYADLIWREDMTQWYPIVLIEEFNPKVDFLYFKNEEPVQSYDPKNAKPYMIMTNKRPKIDLPPEEASGESLV